MKHQDRNVFDEKSSAALRMTIYIAVYRNVQNQIDNSIIELGCGEILTILD